MSNSNPTLPSKSSKSEKCAIVCNYCGRVLSRPDALKRHQSAKGNNACVGMNQPKRNLNQSKSTKYTSRQIRSAAVKLEERKETYEYLKSLNMEGKLEEHCQRVQELLAKQELEIKQRNREIIKLYEENRRLTSENERLKGLNALSSYTVPPTLALANEPNIRTIDSVVSCVDSAYDTSIESTSPTSTSTQFVGIPTSAISTRSVVSFPFENIGESAPMFGFPQDNQMTLNFTDNFSDMKQPMDGFTFSSFDPYNTHFDLDFVNSDELFPTFN
ncbi:hypothetical protein HK098_000987 [Nowakowskiella sp. JEL0407]|nr:hypothetical protein HK098_000987 [Nowakowskiella sp. JEL0407]